MAQEWNPPPPAGGPVQNYLILAILSLLCCWPLAIVAIIFAAQVNGKVATGDMQGALDAAKKAKMFSFIAIGLGVVCIVGYLVFALLVGGLSAINR